MRDTVSAKGELTISLIRNGEAVVKYTYKNLVVEAGRSYIANRLKNNDQAVMSHMAIGTGTAAASASDTALGSEVSRQALTSLSSNGSEGEGTLRIIAGFDGGEGTGEITEAGVFNAASGGTMLCRTTFTAITKQADDRLDIDWLITFSGA